MATFFLVDNSFVIPNDWKLRLANKCSSQLSFMSFTNASLIEGGAVGLTIGAYYGILNFAQSGAVYKAAFIDVFSLMFKIMVGLVLMLPFLIPPALNFETTDAYVAFSCWTLIPTLGGGFVLYGYLDRIMFQLCGSTSSLKKNGRVAEC